MTFRGQVWRIVTGLCVIVSLQFALWWPLSLFLAGLLLTEWLVRRASRDAACVRLALAAYTLKVTLAALMYYGSLAFGSRWSAYPGNEGFWWFSDDAQGYHILGVRMLRFWDGEIVSPEFGFDNLSFVIYVATLYRFFGASPLTPCLLNAWYGTITVAAGLLILRQLGASARGLRLGAAVLGFWPSLLLWSSQLMKDPLVLALLLVSLWICAALPAATRRSRFAAGLLGLAGSLFLLTLVREYLAQILAALLAAAAAFALLLDLVRRRITVSVRYFAMAAAASLVVSVALHLDTRCIAFGRQGETIRALTADLARLRVALTDTGQHLKVVMEDRQRAVEAYHKASARVEWLEDHLRRGTRPVEFLPPPPPEPPPSPKKPFGWWRRKPAEAQQPPAPVVPPEPPPPSRLEPLPANPAADLAAEQAKALLESERILPMEQRLANPSLAVVARPTWQDRLTRFVERIDDWLPLSRLAGRREGFVSTGGGSLVDAHIRIDTLPRLLAYVPRGLSLAFFAPFPSSWLDVDGRLGGLRVFSVLEMLLIYGLFAWALWHLRFVRHVPWWSLGLLLGSIIAMALPMALIVTNLGTLFRLRLQFLLPSLLIAVRLIDERWQRARRIAPAGPGVEPSEAAGALPALSR
jgi:hypothetical protein